MQTASSAINSSTIGSAAPGDRLRLDPDADAIALSAFGTEPARSETQADRIVRREINRRVRQFPVAALVGKGDIVLREQASEELGRDQSLGRHDNGEIEDPSTVRWRA